VVDNKETITFPGRLLIIGCGAVSQCLQPLLVRHLDMDFSRATVIDIEDKSAQSALAKAGAQFVPLTITAENYKEVLSKYVGSGDIIIDLAVDIETKDLLAWCYEHNVRYINTAVELWKGVVYPTLAERTLYPRYEELRAAAKQWHDGPTAIIEHGANPGLVSHWTKVALEEIAQKIIQKTTEPERKKKLEKALHDKHFPHLAWLTGTKVIHISERDMQVTKIPKKVNEFVNTWSVSGLYEEATAPAELGWGTHEKCLPDNGSEHTEGPKNQIYLDRMGMNTLMYSWVPTGAIIGMLIRHGEAFSISNYLTVREGDKVHYRPTVHYVYLPSDSTCDSLNELRMRNYELQPIVRILNDEIETGSDELGVLLLGHDLNGWWVGSTLSIEETRKLVNGQNATTLQVAASILGALFWLLRNPRKGVCVPDDLPHHEVLRVASPYLGQCRSMQIDWHPALHHEDRIGFHKKRGDTEDDKWQFAHFKVVL
jgi:homospermidine synthase